MSVVTGRQGVPETNILVETPMKWADALRYCREHHTDLVSMTSLTENEEIQRMVPEGQLAWIGLFGDSWRWSDGSYSPFRYQWQGPPYSPGEGPHCAHVHNRKWSVAPCNTSSMFLCYCEEEANLYKLYSTKQFESLETFFSLFFLVRRKRSVVRISTDFTMNDTTIQQQFLSKVRKTRIAVCGTEWKEVQVHANAELVFFCLNMPSSWRQR